MAAVDEAEFSLSLLDMGNEDTRGQEAAAAAAVGGTHSVGGASRT